MSNQTLSTSMVEINGFTLSVTTRSVGDRPEVMQALTSRTIGAWMRLAAKIKAEQWELAETERGSVEGRYLITMQEHDIEFNYADAWGDARVTVWDKKGLDLHLNSDDDLQTALYTWKAHKLGIQEALEFFKPKDRQAEPVQPTPPGEKPASPRGTSRSNPGQPPAQQPQPAAGTPPLRTNGDKYFFKKQEAIDKLQVGDLFPMEIVQVAAVSDKKGQRQYEFYANYGGKAGQHAEVTLYADNEIAVNNGLIASLDAMGLNLGETKGGKWVLICTVGKPVVKGDKTYGRVYPQSIT